MTVLNVDDERIDLEAAAAALEAAGFSVLSVDSYERALAVFDEQQDQISIALIDISLPGKNGVDLAQELLRRGPELKILFVSGHVGAEVIRFYGLRASDRHFLKKPFEASQLVSRVEEVLNSVDRLQLNETSRPPKKPREANGSPSAQSSGPDRAG